MAAVYVGGQRDVPISSLMGRYHSMFRIEVSPRALPDAGCYKLLYLGRIKTSDASCISCLSV